MRRTWADFSVPGEGDARFQAGAPPVPEGQGAFPWQGRGDDARFQAGAPPVPERQGAFPWQGRGATRRGMAPNLPVPVAGYTEYARNTRRGPPAMRRGAVSPVGRRAP